MCLEDFEFIVAKQLTFNSPADSFIGLAPNSDPSSLVNKLFDKGEITAKKVGVNFEYSEDKL